MGTDDPPAHAGSDPLCVAQPRLTAEASPSPDAPLAAYAYDAPVYNGPGTASPSERGPPGAGHADTTRDAADGYPHGASARREEATSGPTTTYAMRAQFVHVMRATGKTRWPVGVADAVPVAFDRADVAAKTETSLARTCLRSFSGATLVLMVDGTKKPIEDIKVGDKVVATDPETGERVIRKVTHVWVHDDQLSGLKLGDGTTLTTTEDHLFWSVTDQSFERADHRAAGEVVLGDGGRQFIVVGFEEGTERIALAYNLSIAGVHTYHVGQDAILVHNTCGYTPAGGFAESKLDEVAQAVYQHVGAGDIPGRPGLSQIQEALTKGIPEAVKQGDGTIAQVINRGGVRV